MVMGVTARIVDKFQTWLANKSRLLIFWQKKDAQATKKPEKSVLELPDNISQKLKKAIENLPSNPADVEAILAQLEEAFERWRDDPENEANSVVILSSPVTAVSRILSEAIEDWTTQKQVSVKLLPLKARPNNTNLIQSKLEHHVADNSANQELEIVVIPNLCWCFLRSIEGLKGIEYLQSLLCDRPSPTSESDNPDNTQKNRFWIFGANHVGWDYLNLVFNLQAYCGEVITLPEIESKELQTWLEPIIDEFEITFEKPGIDQKILDQDKDNKTYYFERLNSTSQKVSIVAAQVFLQSIYYREEELEKPENSENSDSESKILVAQTPKLPDLPHLQPADQYLLYSLLLHGDLTISALAESLGDEEAEIQGIVQMLCRYGIVEQHHKTLTINPIYYPRLKQQLKNNNFIINH